MRNILITGATGEIGQSIVTHLADQEVRLIIAARNRDSLTQLKNSISNINNINNHRAYIEIARFDYAEKATYDNVLSRCKKGIEGFVLIPPKMTATKQCLPSVAEWLFNFNRTFVRPLDFFKTILPCLQAVKRSKAVVISGISSKVYLSNYAMNGAIRAAWSAQIKAMGFEYGRDNVHINSLSLGGVMTERFTQQVREEAKEAKKQQCTFEELLSLKTENVPLVERRVN